MLRALGGVIASNLREHDHVSRWLSGDEFLAILPGMETAAAVAVAERQGKKRVARSPGRLG